MRQKNEIPRTQHAIATYPYFEPIEYSLTTPLPVLTISYTAICEVMSSSTILAGVGFEQVA